MAGHGLDYLSEYDLAHFPLVPYKAQSERSKRNASRVQKVFIQQPPLQDIQSRRKKKKSSKTDTVSQSTKAQADFIPGKSLTV